MKVFHKCSLGGLVVILSGIDNQHHICGSTEKSKSLFHRDFCIVFEVPEEKIMAYKATDLDALGHTPWDECRFMLADAKIVQVIGRKTQKIINKDYEFLVNNGFVYTILGNESHEKAIARKAKTLLSVVEPIKGCGYDRSFLNI